MARNLPKINEYLVAHKDAPFEWGVFDCCLMAADIVKLAGLGDPAEGVRGSYSTPSGARKVLKKHFDGLIENAFSHLPEVDPAFAQRGDLILYETSNGNVMAVKWVGGSYCISPEDGMGVMIETDKPIKAWRVE